MAISPPRIPPSVSYFVGERGPEIYTGVFYEKSFTRMSDGSTCSSYPQTLHDGEWFVRAGERQAARSNRFVGFILAMLYVALLVIA